jgi:hypothetical protein
MVEYVKDHPSEQVRAYHRFLRRGPGKIIVEDAPPNAGVFLPRKSTFSVGVDLGFQSDPTAIAVIEQIDGVMDFNDEEARRTNTGLIPQSPARRFHCRHLERFPLKTEYPRQVQMVKSLMCRPPLCGTEDLAPATLLCDGTGVGLPVVQEFTRAGLSPLTVLITSSEDKATYENGCWRVSKALIVSTIDAMLNNEELLFAKALTEAGQLEAELKDFRRFVSAAGRSTWEARSGAHDDLVLAVGIACWWASRPPAGQVAFGTYGQK